jgi:hypothetical protein
MNKIEDSYLDFRYLDLYLMWNGQGYSGNPKTRNDFHENEYQEFKPYMKFRKWEEDNLAHFQDVLIGRYIQEGFWLIAIKKLRKRPPIEHFKLYKLAQREAMRYRLLGGNIGVLCGSASNGLVGIDVDSKDMPELDIKNMHKLFKGFMKKTLTTRTPHGYHFYFRNNKDFLPDKFANKLNKYRAKCRHQSLYMVLPLSMTDEGIYDFVDWEAPILSLNKLLEVM